MLQKVYAGSAGRAALRVSELSDPFHDFWSAPVRNIELVAHEGAAAHALAVENHVDFNGSGPSAFELNLNKEHHVTVVMV